MNNSLIGKYTSITELNSVLSSQIEDLKKNIDEYSKIIGEKLRTNDNSSENDPDFVAIKNKIGESEDPKRKKKATKKDKNSQWFVLDGIQIYNGIGLNGELELYFKAVDKMKANLENLTAVKSSIDSLVTKGVKTELSCIVFQQPDSPYEIAFVKSTVKRENFSFNSIIKTNPEMEKLSIK